MIEAWTTKYALTTGIRLERGEITEDNDLWIRSNGFHSFYHKSEWFTDWDAAVANAEARREAKIASLEGQIAKLRRLDFTAQPKS